MHPFLCQCFPADRYPHVYIAHSCDRSQVEEDAAAEAVAKMMATNVPIDPEAGKDEEEEEEEEYDDPNIPAWQKRIDKADGVKRTKNGTPIRQDGPIGGGPSGPPR